MPPVHAAGEATTADLAIHWRAGTGGAARAPVHRAEPLHGAFARRAGVSAADDGLPYFIDRADGDWQSPAPRPQARPYFLFVGRLEEIKGRRR